MKKQYWVSLVVGLVIVGAGVYVWAGANQKTETEKVEVAQPAEETVQKTEESLNAPVPETEKPAETSEKPVVEEPVKPAKTAYALSQLSTMFVQYKDRHVTVSGQYGGWSHACPASQGKTRSDWVLFDGTSCLFVTGAMPKGLSSIKPNNEAVDVVGVLRTTADGKYYLEGTQVRVK